MRHSLADDTVEQGLQRTASELLEGEKGLMQALGRLREVLRLRDRDVRKPNGISPAPANGEVQTNGNHSSLGLDVNGTGPPTANGTPEQRSSTPNGSSLNPRNGPERIKPLPHISDVDNLWRVTQELLQGQPPRIISFQVTEPGAADAVSANQPTPTPLQRLFTEPSGMTLKAVPHPSHPGLRLPENHNARPKPVQYNLDLSAQTRAVDDALERISELLADCTEYKHRLEEARDRVADVSRARKKVWSIVKERAGKELDRDGKV
jgi:hypothetical protein